MVVVLLSPPLLPAASGDVSIYGVILFSLWSMLKLNSYPRSGWDLNPRIVMVMNRAVV